MKNLVKIVTILLVSLLAFSCASSLSATRTRPAELDLNGANSIAVLPFQVNSKQTEVVNILGLFAFTVGNTNSDEVKLASEVTNAVQEMFLNSGYMQVVGSQRVQEALQGNTAIPCDVYISGSILEFSNKINSQLPPPRSASTPSFGQLSEESAPRKHISASSSPLKSLISIFVALQRRLRISSLLEAPLMQAVANAKVFFFLHPNFFDTRLSLFTESIRTEIPFSLNLPSFICDESFACKVL